MQVDGCDMPYDRDARDVEVEVMFRRAVGDIRLFTGRYGRINVVTEVEWEGWWDVGGIVRDVCDRHVRFDGCEEWGECV